MNRRSFLRGLASVFGAIGAPLANTDFGRFLTGRLSDHPFAFRQEVVDAASRALDEELAALTRKAMLPRLFAQLIAGNLYKEGDPSLGLPALIHEDNVGHGREIDPGAR